MIASIALAHGLPLYTCDPSDYDGIAGLEVVTVPHPDLDAQGRASASRAPGGP